MLVSKIVLGVGVGLALGCAVLFTGCSDIGSVKPAPKAKQEHNPAARSSAAPFNLDSAVGRPTPAFSLKDANGEVVRPADYKGKVVLLDFWATWCGPCKIEIPWFIELEKQYKDQGFAVLGVSMDEDGWSAVKPYVQNMKMNYRVLLGNDDVSNAYGGLDSLPTTLLIDRQGRIASVHVGVSMGKEEFKNAIVQLLKAPGSTASSKAAQNGARREPASDRLSGARRALCASKAAQNGARREPVSYPLSGARRESVRDLLGVRRALSAIDSGGTLALLTRPGTR
jgi:peroxiredoxin